MLVVHCAVHMYVYATCMSTLLSNVTCMPTEAHDLSLTVVIYASIHMFVSSCAELLF